MWTRNLKIKPGNYLLNFIVDGNNVCSDGMNTNKEKTFNILNVGGTEKEIMKEMLDSMETKDSDVEEKEVQNVNIEWHGKANHVEVAGEFSNWVGISMSKYQNEDEIGCSSDLWKSDLLMKPGIYLLNFIVDGQNMCSDDMKTNKEKSFNIII